jgi:signal transduction histidine kinase
VTRSQLVQDPGEAAGSVAEEQVGGEGQGLVAGGGAEDAGSPAAAASGPDTGPRGLRRPGGWSRLAVANWRVRWRLAAVIAVPAAVAAVFGGLTIYGDVTSASQAGRVQHLAQLNASVVRLTQALEDERDLSAGYAANRQADSTLARQLEDAQNATSSAVQSVQAEAAGIGTSSGYQAATVGDLSALLESLNDLTYIRQAVIASPAPVPKIIQVYTGNVIEAATTLSASIGNGTSDAGIQGNVTALGALLRAENQMSVQRAILFAALSSSRPMLTQESLTGLQQAQQQQAADQADFTASTSQPEQQDFSNTVSGSAVGLARSQETLAESMAAGNQPLAAHDSGLTAQGWYGNMTATVARTRQVTGQLVTAITARAGVLKSQAARNLLVTSAATLLVLFLVLLVSIIVARSLVRPLRKLRADALDVADRRLPEMVRRLSQGEGTDADSTIEPIGVTSTDEIGEVARAFDQVHSEAVRLAGDEAMLRGNLNAMFVNLSRRSQLLVERQLSVIDSLEQSEQDPARLSSLFRLDHLATRMRRNSENLLVLAGHEVVRLRSQPVPLVDVLRAAISEIEQYERVVLNVQPGIVVAGRAVSDIVHLVAEIVENATTFSPEDTPVHVSGQPLSSGGVLLDITDNGTGISDQEMSHANWRLDNPPVVDVAASRRMGLFVVGRLAARHGVRVRLRHAQPGGLTALIWLPDMVAAPEVAPPPGTLRRFEVHDYGSAPSLSAPPMTAASQAAPAASMPRFTPLPSPSFTPGVPEALAASRILATGGRAPAQAVPGAQAAPDGGGGPDPGAADPGTVAVPPAAVQDQRLPIFDSLESEWFRRSGKRLDTMPTRGTETPVPAARPWTSPADEGWRAAQALTAPTAGEITGAGLPRRVPGTNLVPGSVRSGDGAESDLPARSPDAARTRMTGFQRGVREGRAAAPQIEEP